MDNFVFITPKVNGKRIAHLRKERGMTQKELAAAIGKRTAQVSMWEKGSCNPRREVVAKIAEVFQVDPIYFITADK